MSMDRTLDAMDPEARALADMEAAARRALAALGGGGDSGVPSPGSRAPGPVPAPGSAFRPQGARRRFVRDGQVPVEKVSGLRGRPGAQDQDALRTAVQGLAAERAARGRCEGLLALAQQTIRELQAQVAHERGGRLAAEEGLRVSNLHVQRFHAMVSARDSELAYARRRAEGAPDLRGACEAISAIAAGRKPRR